MTSDAHKGSFKAGSYDICKKCIDDAEKSLIRTYIHSQHISIKDICERVINAETEEEENKWVAQLETHINDLRYFEQRLNTLNEGDSDGTN